MTSRPGASRELLVSDLIFGRRGFTLSPAQPPHVLSDSAQIAFAALLLAGAAVILALVMRCLWKAVGHGSDQQPATGASGLGSTAARGNGKGFWESLTPDEQTDLTDAAAEITFPAGQVLCRERQRADQLYVIRSGRVKVCAESPAGQQLVAIRQAGDIIGERAALRVTKRSATITTLEPVTAYVVLTGDFTAFLERHPRVLPLIEDELYRRLTENRPYTSFLGEPAAGVTPPEWTGQNCTIVLIDIVNYGARTRNDRDRRKIRAALYHILQGLIDGAALRHDDYHREDRGDGILLIISPRVPTSSIAECILSNVIALLRQHNDEATAATSIQMRVALHVGPVVSDAHGVDGRAIIDTARLLDAPPLKRDLFQSGADLGFITSDFVYDTIIQPNPGHVDPALYHRLRCQVKEEFVDAWVYLAGTAGGSEPSAVRGLSRK